MSKILIFSTWFPYPLNQGSKIRAYHLIRALAKEHQLALISFEDQPVQQEWMEHLSSFCSIIKVLDRKPFKYSRLKTILGFFSTQPSAVFAGYSSEMEKLVKKTAKDWQPDLVFAFTFVTAPYALKIRNIRRVVDMDNLLAIMLKEEIASASGRLSKLRRHLAYLKFRHYEDKIYSPFERCLVVSEQDEQKVQHYTHLQPKQIWVIPNGVNTVYYHPNGVQKQPHQLIYNGALSYAPNLDAMQYFLTEIFPLILNKIPDVSLHITGKSDPTLRERLPFHKNVIFTGYLDDIRPAIQHSTVCVVPLRQGAGTRLKILEAMAAGTVVVSTNKGAVRFKV